MKFLIFCSALLMTKSAFAQTIVNVVLVDSNSHVTTKPEKAKYFIAIKKFNDSSFERLEYKFAGPRVRAISFKDPELKIKHGRTYNYNDSGNVVLSGSYTDNKKSGTWYDVVTEIFQEFENDVLVSERTREKKDTSKTELKREEIESAYPGGINSYLKFLNKNFRYPDRALKLRKEGSVVCQFSVDKQGKPGEFGIARSVEFSLDEEVLRLASMIPNWIPATIDGVPVKSYKKQPISFKIPL